MQNNKLVIALIMLSFLAAGTSIGLLISEQILNNSGTIIVQSLVIKSYSDSACTIPISTLSWGTLNQGSHKEITIYLKNTGNVPATLTCSFTGWSPLTASTYITPTWNRTGSTLAAGASVSATFSLDVSETISGITTFSYTATITATLGV
jgi:hypothetical protein